jgi:hypothetical protein
MDKFIPVKGNSSLVRDSRTGAIVNINTQEINDARERKALKQKDKQEIQDLKNDVAEIKQLLTKLVERL